MSAVTDQKTQSLLRDSFVPDGGYALKGCNTLYRLNLDMSPEENQKPRYSCKIVSKPSAI